MWMQIKHQQTVRWQGTVHKEEYEESPAKGASFGSSGFVLSRRWYHFKKPSRVLLEEDRLEPAVSTVLRCHKWA
jgi:hypothetical protein